MHSKEVVLVRYPRAEAKYHKANADADMPHDRYPHWSVYDSRAGDSRMLGVSMSEDGAWVDAATTVLAEGTEPPEELRTEG